MPRNLPDISATGSPGYSQDSCDIAKNKPLLGPNQALQNAKSQRTYLVEHAKMRRQLGSDASARFWRNVTDGALGERNKPRV